MQIQSPTRLAVALALSCSWLATTTGCQNGPLQNRFAQDVGQSTFAQPVLPSVIAATTNDQELSVRGQSPDGSFWYGNNQAAQQPAKNTTFAQPARAPQTQPAAQPVYQAGNIATVANNNGFAPAGGAYTPGSVGNNNGVQKASYQYPELAPSNNRNILTGNGLGSPNIGAPNTLNPIVQPFERGGNASVPFGNVAQPYFADADYADLDVAITQTQTGRINIGGAYNSDNGIVGQFTIDEKDFDITRFPRNFRDIIDGNAFRGGGQAFRLELVPGQDLQRYLVSFTEPYFLGTDYSFSASGYLFDRRYDDYDEERLGGRFSFGRRLNPDLTVSAGLRLESVTIDNPRLDTSPELNNSLGNSDLFVGNIGLIRDTRDHPFLATAGSYLAATFSQAFGDFDYSRADLEYRRYRLIYERPDRSGRHTLSYGTKLGFSGSDTPVFENYFAGGFSTMRGFDFRGAAPLEGGVRVGGEFQWLSTIEYQFPLTADDMVRGVAFVDYGTVERDIELNSENFRVAPGVGLRVNMPAAGIGAPLAFDFAFPISTAEGDSEKVFSFYLGVLR